MFLGDGRQELALDHNLDVVSNVDISSLVALVLLVHIFEQKGNIGLGIVQYTWRGQFLGERNKVVVWASFVDSMAL